MWATVVALTFFELYCNYLLEKSPGLRVVTITLNLYEIKS